MGEPGVLGLDSVSSTGLLFFFNLLQFAVFLVVLRYVDVYEREPYGPILVMFAWGGLGATLISIFLNTWVIRELLPPDLAAVFGPAIAAPIVEETAKAVALVAALLVARLFARRWQTPQFGGVTDGIILGAAVGFGFAFEENMGYFVQAAAEGGFPAGADVLFLRADFGGLASFGHATYTAMTGAGLGLAAWSRSWAGRVGWPALGLAGAMLAHAAWNGGAQALVAARYGYRTLVDWFTVGVDPALAAELDAAFVRALTLREVFFSLLWLGMLATIALWLRYERRIIRYELAEEVNTGFLPRDEYEVVPRFWRRTRSYTALLLSGRLAQLRAVHDLHDRLVELAMLKWRLRRAGRESAAVADLREEIDALRGCVGDLAAIPAAPPRQATQA